MSGPSAPTPAAGAVQDRSTAAWELVRTVRWAAGQLIPHVDRAAAGVMNLYEEDELMRFDPALARALTVMVGVLTSMQSAMDMLDWLEASGSAVSASLPPDARSITRRAD